MLENFGHTRGQDGQREIENVHVIVKHEGVFHLLKRLDFDFVALNYKWYTLIWAATALLW